MHVCQQFYSLMFQVFSRKIFNCISLINSFLLVVNAKAKEMMVTIITSVVNIHNRNRSDFYSKPARKQITPGIKLFFASAEMMITGIRKSGKKMFLRIVKTIANKNFIIQAKGAIILNGVYIFKSDKVEIIITDINFFVSNTSKRRCHSWRCPFFKLK